MTRWRPRSCGGGAGRRHRLDGGAAAARAGGRVGGGGGFPTARCLSGLGACGGECLGAATVVRRWRGRAAAAERRGDRSHVPASVSGAEAAPPPLAAGAA